MSRDASRSWKSNSPPKSSFKTPTSNSRSTQRNSRRLRKLDTRLGKNQKTVRHCMESIQRDIFDWYEEYQEKNTREIWSPDAGDILSSERQDRLKGWCSDFGNEFGQDIQVLYDKVDSYKKVPEDLELGLLFLAHPISTFALWHVLQACYKLDKIICGASKNESIE